MRLSIHKYLRNIALTYKGKFTIPHLLHELENSSKCVVPCLISSKRSLVSASQSKICCQHSKKLRVGLGHELLSCRTSVFPTKAREFHGGSSEYDGDSDDEDERDPELRAEKLLQDVDADLQVRQFYGMPGSGHLLYVIQPAPRRVPSETRDLLTTPELQLEEAIALVHSVPKWQVAEAEILKVHRMKSKHIFGPGQMDTLTRNIRLTPSITAVFVAVDNLSGLQLAALQKCWKLPIFDRTTVVLQIFKEHAKTKESKIQVALAELPYIRTRMLEEDYGDTETSSAQWARKTGELFLNARYMMLEKREAKLKRALEALKSQRSLLRSQRAKRNIPTVAVIGYTNSGKTTLIKTLTGDREMAPRDQLFATLDVTAHAAHLPNTMLAVFMDTVGFMSNLPRSLSTAFAATLEDAMCADLIVHVLDVSHPNRLSQRGAVHKAVSGMLDDTRQRTMIEVCNKVDKITCYEDLLEEDPNIFYISSVTGEGLDTLRHEVQTRLLHNIGLLQKRIRVPMSGEHLSWLHREATVTETETDTNTESLIVHVIINKENYAKFAARFSGAAKSKMHWLHREATVTETETDTNSESLIVHVIINKENYAKFAARFGGGAKAKTQSRYE